MAHLDSFGTSKVARDLGKHEQSTHGCDASKKPAPGARASQPKAPLPDPKKGHLPEPKASFGTLSDLVALGEKTWPGFPEVSRPQVVSFA